MSLDITVPDSLLTFLTRLTASNHMMQERWVVMTATITEFLIAIAGQHYMLLS